MVKIRLKLPKTWSNTLPNLSLHRPAGPENPHSSKVTCEWRGALDEITVIITGLSFKNLQLDSQVMLVTNSDHTKDNQDLKSQLCVLEASSGSVPPRKPFSIGT